MILVINPAHMVTMAKMEPPLFRISGVSPTPKICSTEPIPMMKMYSSPMVSRSLSAPSSLRRGLAKSSTTAVSRILEMSRSHRVPATNSRAFSGFPSARKIE